MFNVLRAGPPGIPGEPGPKGKDGKNGVGERGYDGKTGPTGPPGKDGKGEKGEKGDKGEDGKGEKGDKGDNGETQFGGPTGPTGNNGMNGVNGIDGNSITGPAGPTGAKGDDGKSVIIYNDLTIHAIKILGDYKKITTNTPIYITGDNYTSINIGVMYTKLITNANNYIKYCDITKNGFTLSYDITTSSAMKCVHVSSAGNIKSVPIVMSDITIHDEYHATIYFKFDSEAAYTEYIYYGAIYDIFINWF